MRRASLSHRLQVVCLLVGLFWAGSAPGTAQAQQAAATDTSVYDFGLHLFHPGDYYRAITEFKRFSLLFPNLERQPATQPLIGLALQDATASNAALARFHNCPITVAPPAVTS